MNLGEQIYELRTQARMSQGDLADALGVSRQSVSKWENNNAVPDLDKLVKLSQLFGITLDELVTGAVPVQDAPQPQPEAPVPVRRPNRTPGWVLFAGGLAVFLVLSLLGGLLTGALFSLPLLVPGIICLIAQKRLALKCAWAEFFLVALFLMYGTGTHWGTFLAWLRNWDLFMEHGNIGHFILSSVEILLILILWFWTVRSYNKDFKPLTKRGMVFLALCWGLCLLSHLPLSLSIDPLSVWYLVFYNLFNWGRLFLLTILLVFSHRLYLQLRKKKV